MVGIFFFFLVLVSGKNAINGGANLICIEIDKNKDVMMKWREKETPT